AEQGFLCREIAVHRAFADAGLAGDLGEVEVLQRAALELAAHGAHDLLARFLTLAVALGGGRRLHDSRTVTSFQGRQRLRRYATCLSKSASGAQSAGESRFSASRRRPALALVRTGH